MVLEREIINESFPSGETCKTEITPMPDIISFNSVKLENLKEELIPMKQEVDESPQEEKEVQEKLLEIDQKDLQRKQHKRKLKNKKIAAKHRKIEGSVGKAKKSKKNFDKKKKQKNSYHDSYHEKNLAKIPDFIETDCNDDDNKNESIIYEPVSNNVEVNQEDMDRLLAEINLPFDNILLLFTSMEYDVEKTIKMAEDLVVPTMVPKFVKDFFAANVVENEHGNSLNEDFKNFYFDSMSPNVIEKKYLVENYNNEKNKIEVKWMSEKEDKIMSSEEREAMEIEKKMWKISIIDEQEERNEAKKKEEETNEHEPYVFHASDDFFQRYI